ncbi:competence protein ComG, partial [Staphylococcus hominis]
VLLNNVINAEFQILPSNIIKLNLKIGDKNDYYEKNLFL